MSFLSKTKKLFVEDGDENVLSSTLSNNDLIETNSVNAEQTPTVVGDTLNLISIDDVYDKNNLQTKDKSIYKVNEIKNALPDMTSDATRASIIGMLNVSKISLEEIQDDAHLRTDAIIGTLEQFAQETDKMLTDSRSLIEEKEKEIDELKKKIDNREKLQEQQEEVFTRELTLIKNTIAFITQKEGNK